MRADNIRANYERREQRLQAKAKAEEARAQAKSSKATNWSLPSVRGRAPALSWQPIDLSILPCGKRGGRFRTGRLVPRFRDSWLFIYMHARGAWLNVVSMLFVDDEGVDLVESQLELVEGTPMHFHIQERFVTAQSWWIATELVRRNPQLRIVEWHPGGGQYDALGMLDLALDKMTISLNRRGGSIHLLEYPDFEPIEWSEVFSNAPHAIVERIEKAGGLTPPAQTPPTERHTLTYRIITTILAQMVNSKTTWDARSAFADTSGYGSGPIERIFDRFPSAARQREAMGRVAVLGDASHAFWSLNRNDDVVAVLDQWGMLHLQKGEPADLMQIFAANRRSLTATIGQSFGRILN